MRNKVSVLFLLTGVLFAASLLIANLLASKIIQIGPWSAPAGVLIFPVSYIINDVIAEVWGYRKARLIIWAGFGVNLLAAFFFALSIVLPAAPFYEHQLAYETILGSSIRLVFASLMAYWAGSFLNAYVMSRFKVLTKGKGFSFRAIVSTLAGEGADSLIFILVAFIGVFPISVILTMVLTQALLKTAYEIIVLPLTILVVRKVKEIEGEDAYDEHISYNPFRIDDV